MGVSLVWDVILSRVIYREAFALLGVFLGVWSAAFLLSIRQCPVLESSRVAGRIQLTTSGSGVLEC